MNKLERNEIAVTVNAIMRDDCDEIRRAYMKLNGSLTGLRNYVHKECVAFWTNCDPYLDKTYLDYEWIEVDGKIINFDDCWCFILDGLEFEVKKAHRSLKEGSI